MGIELPFRPDGSVKEATALQGFENGKFPGQVLVPCGIRKFRMAEPAASAMRAMVAAAQAQGISISATGTWRSYEEQERLFLSRYVTHDTGGERKVWRDVQYWKLPEVASAATPGTSNHGKGISADLSTTPTVALDGATLQWLAVHGPTFGFWNTVHSENWHWTYCLVDDLPPGIAPQVNPARQRSVDWAAIAAIDAEMRAVEFPGEQVLGSTGKAVQAIQWKLVSFGHEVETSGVFDEATSEAVRAFQRMQRLGVDGRVGSKTWAALGLPGAGDPPPPPPNEAPPAAAEATATMAAAVISASYEVRPGDGFLVIAQRTLWSSTMADAESIAAANGLTIRSMISPGQVLQIPACRCTSVAEGEEWSAVAVRLGADPAVLQESNAWQGGLKPGMVIYGGRMPV